MKVCRNCEKERLPPIEGPCPHCRGYYRTIERLPPLMLPGGPGLRRRSGEEDDEEEDGGRRPRRGPVPIGALLDMKQAAALQRRHPTGLSGLDYVFGGGLPETGAVLFCAHAGTGKTSLLMELLLTLPWRSLLLSTEQSKADLLAQFGRLGADRLRRASSHMFVESETRFPAILAAIRDLRPQLLALDSLHEVEGVRDDNDNPMAASNERTVTRVAKILRRLSRKVGFFAFLVGHMSNDGTMMGGAHLRHAVDATLMLGRASKSDKDPRRVLRFRGKTRLGPLGREALFRMTAEGLRDCGPLDPEKEPEPPKGPRPRLTLVPA